MHVYIHIYCLFWFWILSENCTVSSKQASKLRYHYVWLNVVKDQFIGKLSRNLWKYLLLYICTSYWSLSQSNKIYS